MRAQAQSVVVPFFDRVARLYDFAALQRLVYRPNQDEVVAQLRERGARRIVDVGCGTGLLTSRLRRELEPEEIHGCDLSEGMLDQARARDPRVSWHVAPAEQLPFAGESMDAIISTEAFHFFDQPVALREFHRVLAPGGHLIVASFNAVFTPGGRPLRLGGLTYSTPAGVRRLVQDAGFRVLEQPRIDRGLQWLTPTVATVAVRAVIKSVIRHGWNAVTGGHTTAYRLTGGLIGHRMLGVPPTLLLDHVGAKSGQKRTTPLSYLRDGDSFVIVASMGGAPRNPAWFHNLRAHPDTHVQVGTSRRAVHARVATAEERDRLWPRVVSMYRGYELYQRRTDRTIPLVVLEPR